MVALAITRITGLVITTAFLRRWQIELKEKFYINNIEINTLLFADDQVILANPEDNLQRAIHRLNVISKDYNMRISTDKTKVLALSPIRIKIVINERILEQVLNSNCVLRL
jgi:hypothetical protein